MATLRERQTYREKIMRALYRATEGNRLLGVDGAKLRDDLGIPEQDLAAACTYLADEGWVVVDWARGNTPAMVTLTHRGIQQMETDEEKRG
jgi:DNA-binding transcriptional regulator PaaX